jgi:hypothetical protein
LKGILRYLMAWHRAAAWKAPAWAAIHGADRNSERTLK